MAPQPLEFEGTWEEIISHANELAGRKVRLTVLTSEPPAGSNGFDDDEESFTSFWESETPEEIFARQGIQPVTTLTTFLESLPDFGEDALNLWEVIAENRAQRRASTGDADC
jgi:hypothetical protein